MGAIVGFTGTQLGMTYKQKFRFRHVIVALEPSAFHHGDCIGADAEAHDMVRLLFPSCRIIGHPPKDDSKRAFCKFDHEEEKDEYLNRNRAIVHSVDTLIATPKEAIEVLRSGTWATVRYARKTHPFVGKKNIGIILPEGKIEWRV